MLWFRRTKKQKDKELEGKAGEPYLLSGDLRALNVEAVYYSPPDIEYSIWANRDEKKNYGSFEVRMCVKVKRAYNAEILEGGYCYIEINDNAGQEFRKLEMAGTLGYMKIIEGSNELHVKLELNDRYVSDIVRLIRDYKPEDKGVLKVRLDIENERRHYASWVTGSKDKRLISYDVVRFFCYCGIE